MKNKSKLLKAIQKCREGGPILGKTKPSKLDTNFVYPIEDAAEYLFGKGVFGNIQRRDKLYHAAMQGAADSYSRSQLRKASDYKEPIPDVSMPQESTRVNMPIRLKHDGKHENGGNLGGFMQSIAPIVSLIPGAAPVGAGLNMIGQLAQQNTEPAQMPLQKQYRIGGDFKQYNAPSHEQGGQLIDANGNPNTLNPAAEIEKSENSYDGYVYSDTLINPETGNTYAKDAAMIAKKTKGKDDISKTSRILQMMKLKQANKFAAQQAESEQEVPIAEDGLELNKLPTLTGRVEGGTDFTKYPYPELMVDVTGTRGTTPMSQFYTVTGDNQSYQGGIQGSSETRGLSNLNKAAMATKLAALGAGAVDAMRGVEEEQLQQPDYTRGDSYMQGLEIDMTPMLNEIDMQASKAVQDVSNQAGGIGARNSRVASILARAGRNKAFTNMQQQQVNAGIKQALAGREDRKAEVGTQERIRQQIAQSQNEATGRLAARKFFSDLSQVGTTMNQIQYTNDLMKNQNENAKQALNYGLAILSQKYPNFKPSDDFIQRLNSGTLTPEDGKILDRIIQFTNQ